MSEEKIILIFAPIVMASVASIFLVSFVRAKRRIEAERGLQPLYQEFGQVGVWFPSLARFSCYSDFLVYKVGLHGTIVPWKSVIRVKRKRALWATQLDVSFTIDTSCPPSTVSFLSYNGTDLINHVAERLDDVGYKAEIIR